MFVTRDQCRCSVTSSHNSEVSLLYMKALISHGFTKKQCHKLIRQCFSRLKEAERPKSANELACRQKTYKKNSVSLPVFMIYFRCIDAKVADRSCTHIVIALALTNSP